MTTVNFAAGLPGGTGHAYRKIRVVLVHGGAGGSDGLQLIGGEKIVKLDEDGTGALTLEDNDAITPAGTFYRATLDGAMPPVVRHFSLASDTPSPVSWADPSIQVVTPVPPGWEPVVGPEGPEGPEGPDGPPMGSSGLLAARPSSAAVPNGYVYTATDDNGGTAYVSNGVSWERVAPSVNAVGGSLLDQVTPSTVASITCTAGDTPYRIPELTLSFTMPDRPVLVFSGQIRAKRSTNAATTARLSLQYTTNNWSTRSVLVSPAIASSTDLVFGIVNTYDWFFGSVPIPAAAGAAVQVAYFIQNSTAGAIMDIYATGSGVEYVPHLTAVALGA